MQFVSVSGAESELGFVNYVAPQGFCFRTITIFNLY